MVYAEYLERTGKKLFNVPIKAYPYGPVVSEVYEYYKKYGRSYIPADESDFTIEAEIKNKPVMTAKLLASDDSDVIFAVIKHVLEVYDNKTPLELVDITHAENSPWSHTKNREIISDEDILKYREFERDC